MPQALHYCKVPITACAKFETELGEDVSGQKVRVSCREVVAILQTKPDVLRSICQQLHLGCHGLVISAVETRYTLKVYHCQCIAKDILNFQGTHTNPIW